MEIFENSTDFCTICLKKCDNKFMELNCGHKFHKNCLREWVISQNNIILGSPNDDLAVKGTCPLCRKRFSKVFLSDNYYDDFKIKKSDYPYLFLKIIYRAFKKKN